jgi:hypothetical protein
VLNTPDLLLRILWFYILLPVCALAPGWVVLRRVQLRPLERLSASIGFSLILLYLVAMLFYWTRAPEAAYYLACFACFFVSIVGWRKWAASSRRLRSIASGYALLVLWLLLLLLLIRNYSGGVCSIDWLEHYRRAHYFLTPPANVNLTKSIIAENIPMTSRPPLMNAVAAFFLALTGDRYELFQVILSALNLLFWFPLVMMLPWLGRGRKSNRNILLLLLMASSMVIWNATWTWTKLFTAFYVILGLAFYLEGWRRVDPARISLAFLFLTAGFLSHFSAGPYLLFLGVHYVLFLLPRRSQLWGHVSNVPVAPLATASLCLALLTTWFGYAVLAAGPRYALGSSTTARAFVESSAAESLSRIAKNTIYSFVPHPFHLPRQKFEEMLGYNDVPIANGENRTRKAENSSATNPYGYFRDYLLSIYGPTFTFALGSMGGLLCLWLVFRKAPAGAGQHRVPNAPSPAPLSPSRGRGEPRTASDCRRSGKSLSDYEFLRARPGCRSVAPHRPPNWRFGWGFIVVTALIGIAAHPSLEEFGVAQICGQPLILLGLGFLASRFLLLPRWLRYIGLAGYALDFVLVGLIHVTMEMQNPKVTKIGSLYRVSTDLSIWAWFNARAKYAQSAHFLGDYFSTVGLGFQIAVLALFAAVWWRAVKTAGQEACRVEQEELVQAPT